MKNGIGIWFVVWYYYYYSYSNEGDIIALFLQHCQCAFVLMTSFSYIFHNLFIKIQQFSTKTNFLVIKC